MAEQPLELRRINWSECCAFTQLFRTFRMAIRPGKWALATLGVIATFLLGWALDVVWQSYRPQPGELQAYWQVSNLARWRESARAAQANRMQALYAALPVQMPENLVKELEQNPDRVIDKYKEAAREQYHKEIQNAEPGRQAEIADRYNHLYAQAEALRPRGVFTSFIAYQSGVLKQAMDAGASLNIFGGMRDVFNARRDVIEPAGTVQISSIGLLGCVLLMLRGVQWLVTQHPMFTLLFGLGTLAIWALLGGAICRMAALNFARDEGIAPRAALTFAARKYVGFLSAPLLPVGMILLIGVFLFLGGLFMAIPYIGEVLGTLLLPLALLGGLVIALVLTGFLAGGSLFYPTIAVEGSDSFDAMSRSYSYIFTKPWRAIFYALVAFIYGALCYLFLRFFTLVLLKGTRAFVSAGTDLVTDRPGTGIEHASKLEAMWPNPTFENLWQPPAAFGMIRWEGLGSLLTMLWVGLVIAALIGFLVSFYYCASTIIYFLLRREVDATDLDDVYLDEEETEPEPLAASATPSAPATPSTPVASTPTGTGVASTSATPAATSEPAAPAPPPPAATPEPPPAPPPPPPAAPEEPSSSS